MSQIPLVTPAQALDILGCLTVLILIVLVMMAGLTGGNDQPPEEPINSKKNDYGRRR